MSDQYIFERGVKYEGSSCQKPGVSNESSLCEGCSKKKAGLLVNLPAPYPPLWQAINRSYYASGARSASYYQSSSIKRPD